MDKIIDAIASEPGITIGTILGSLGIIGATVIVTVACWTDAWRKVRETEELGALKRDMLQSGMSADEIATVVAASPKSSFAKSLWQHRNGFGHGCAGSVSEEQQAAV